MGWLWASPSPPKPSSPAQNQSTNPPPSPPQAQAPNEPVDPEIQKFYDLFKSDTSSTPSQNESSQSQPQGSTSSPSSASDSSKPSWLSSLSSSSSSSRTTKPADAPHGTPVSEALLPSTMSCTQAFDLAYACSGLSGQFNAVYRHGEMRQCSALWDDFWFCMRTRGMSADRREIIIKQHYRNKEWEKYYARGKRSSEDVWEARGELVEKGTAFVEEVVWEGDDERWREEENARRRQVRDGLGFDKGS